MSIAFAALWTAAACTPDKADVDEPQLPDDGRGWVSVTLHSPSFDSRADSHPDEDAVNHESDVNNITLFIYTAANGLNSPAETPIHEARYFDSSSFDIEDSSLGRTIKITFKTRDYNLSKNDRIAVVANLGDLSLFKTLGDLQQYIPSENTWTAGTTIADCTDFAMTSSLAEDGILKTANNVGIPGTKANPFAADMTIERMAARIDLNHDNGTWVEDGGEKFMLYTAYDKDRNVKGKVYVSHVVPFNVMQQPSYALKRISDPATEDLSCFDKWSYTGTLPKEAFTGKPTHYVIEPNTSDKGDDSKAADWFGATRAELIAQGGHDWFTTQPRLAIDASKNYTILSYANENTAHVNHTRANTLTGIVIRAQYVPAQLHTNIKLENPKTDVPRGTDLWRYMSRKGTTSEGDVLYFETEELAKAYQAKHAEDMATITKFASGVCYYHLWLKHTVLEIDNAQRPTFPMEYGIVRNHIYRVSFSFSGIGREGVTVEDPWNVKMTIFVRPWHLVKHPEIIM